MAAEAGKLNREAALYGARTSEPQPQRDPSCRSLHGLGDKDYPVSTRIASAFGDQKRAVNSLSKEWQDQNCEAVHCDSEIPDTKPRNPCSDVCMAGELAAMTEGQKETLQRLVGLLKNITREMKTPFDAHKRQLGLESRHPMLLFQCGGHAIGWLLTQPSFKPLTFDSIKLVVPAPLPEEDFCDFCVELSVVPAGRGEMWDFASLNRVAVDVVHFHARAGQEQLLYCYTRKYKLRSNSRLSQLYLDLPLRWCDFSAADVGGDDNDDDDNRQEDGQGSDGDDDEEARTKEDMTCIDDMVSNLTSTPSAGQPDVRKRPSRSATAEINVVSCEL